MLENNYFTIVDQGGKQNGEYYITSKRKGKKDINDFIVHPYF